MSCGPKICAGDLNEVVSYQEATRADDGAGGTAAPVWAEKFVIYCKVVEKSGKEAFQHQRLETQNTVEFMTRYRSDITTLGRLVLDGKNHNIRRVDDINRAGEWLLIVADAGVVD